MAKQRDAQHVGIGFIFVLVLIAGIVLVAIFGAMNINPSLARVTQQQALAAPPPIQTVPIFNLAIVLNSGAYPTGGSVSIIDTLTNQVVTTVTLPNCHPIAGCGWPVSPNLAAMTPDGRYAYVAGLANLPFPGTQGRLYKIDLSTFVATDLNIVASAPFYTELEISPNSQYLVATYNQLGKVQIINTATDTLLQTLTLGSGGGQIMPVVFSPNSQFAYVGYYGPPAAPLPPTPFLIRTINLATQTIVGSLPMPLNSLLNPNFRLIDLRFGAFPYLVATFHPCYQTGCFVRIYNVNTGTYQDAAQTNEVEYWDIEPIGGGLFALGDISYPPILPPGVAPLEANGYITIVNPTSGNIVAQIPVSQYAAWSLTYDSTNNRLWSLCTHPGPPSGPPFNTYCQPGYIDVFDLNTFSMIATVTASLDDGFPSLSQNGQYFYAIDPYPNNRIVAVNTITYAVTYIPVGIGPKGIFMQGDAGVKENYS